MNQYSGMGGINQGVQNRYMPNMHQMPPNIPPQTNIPPMQNPQNMMNMQNPQNVSVGGMQNMRGYPGYMPPYMANQQSTIYVT
jgi:hypothetical protein